MTQCSSIVSPNYNVQYVTQLFDQMSPSYDVVNLLSSFGFSEIWRAQCVKNLRIPHNAVVADLMSGSGECWNYLRHRIRPQGRIISVDISKVMCGRQHKRATRRKDLQVDIRCENALCMNLPDASVDFAVSAFGLKTFDSIQIDRLAAEAFRVLRPGGAGSFLEISLPEASLLRVIYRCYINLIIPILGRFFLKDIECYRMLGVYTDSFGSCERVLNNFKQAGFDVILKRHFFGCASSIILKKPLLQN